MNSSHIHAGVAVVRLEHSPLQKRAEHTVTYTISYSFKTAKRESVSESVSIRVLFLIGVLEGTSSLYKRKMLTLKSRSVLCH